MIEKAENADELKKGAVIIEPTSGNTGIGLAMVAAVKGYHLLLVMPDSMSVERQKLMRAYGAEIILTPGRKGMKGALEKANKLKDKLGAWMPMQFKNPANPGIHMLTTAKEILNDFPEGIDYLITGVGTGGHISGLAAELKKRWPSLIVLAVEPEDSSVLSGGKPGPHAIQGIGAGFIPPNLAVDLLDGIIRVSKSEAYNYAIKAAREEGLFVGISSGASLAAISQIQNILKGKRVLTFAYDSGERYLSVEGFIKE